MSVFPAAGHRSRRRHRHRRRQAVVYDDYGDYARRHFRRNTPFRRLKIPFCTCIPQLWGFPFLSLTKFTPCGKFITFGNDTIHNNFVEALARRHDVYIRKWQHGVLWVSATPYMELSRSPPATRRPRAQRNFTKVTCRDVSQRRTPNKEILGRTELAFTGISRKYGSKAGDTAYVSSLRTDWRFYSYQTTWRTVNVRWRY